MGSRSLVVQRGTLAAMALLLVVIALGACSDEENEPNLEPLTPELEAVMQQVAGLRGLPPAIGIRAATVPRSEAADTIEKLLTDDDRQTFDELTTLYRLLGHLQPDQDFASVYREFVDGAVAGFYAPPDKAFYVVSSADEVDFSAFDRQQKSTTAHEFVHALQDAEFDLLALSERTRGDLDWSLALTAVIEGDAVVHEGLWSKEFALAAGGGRGLLFAQPRFTTVPESIEREFRFPYSAGSEWVATARAQRGIEAINGILRGRPMTTAEILHPELYESGWEPAEVSLPDISSALGDGWRRESSGAFGEFQLRNFLQLELGAIAAVAAAAGWTGDHYDAYLAGAESVATLRLSFTSAQEVDEFRGAMVDWNRSARAILPEGTPGLAVLEGGRTIVTRNLTETDVLMIFGSNRHVAEQALALLSVG